MLFGLLSWCFAALAWWMAAYLWREIRNTKHWQITSGTILERGVGASMNSGNFNHLAYVKYKYSVADKEYTNDQVYLHKQTGMLDWQVKKLVNNLPNPTPVHYDPEHPESSYLIETSRAILWILIAFGVLAFLFGVVWILGSV